MKKTNEWQIKLLEDNVRKGILGYWYRLWWRFLLGAKFYREKEGVMVFFDDYSANKQILSLCEKCYCMTKTIKGRCGKCKSRKD